MKANISLHFYKPYEQAIIIIIYFRNLSFIYL